MKRALIMMILMLLYPVSAPLTADEDRSIFTYQYYLSVNDAPRVIDALRKYVSDSNGYVKQFSNQMITMRVPRKEAEDLRSKLSSMGFILDERKSRLDVSEKLLDFRTRLKAKEKLLSDLYAIFNTAQFEQTVEVEKAVGAVIVEIENLKGNIHYYRDRIALCDVTVHLNVGTGRGGGRENDTKYDWIRGLGIPSLINY